MARFSKLFSDGDFASGVTFYEDSFPGDSEDNVRIVVYAVVAGILTPFIVDTGAPWCVLDPRLAQLLIEDGQTDHIDDIKYRVRTALYSGALIRLALALQDESTGDHTTIEATFFVPSLQPEDEWREPNFIGLKGCLERVRCAIDPEENAFYFGRV